MSAVQTAFTELADSLQEAGLNVVDYIPEQIVPPLVVTASSDNFIAPLGTMGGKEFRVNAELFLHVHPTPNKEALENLFTMLETVIAALEEGDNWRWTTVGPPTMFSHAGNAILTIRVQVNSLIELGVD